LVKQAGARSHLHQACNFLNVTLAALAPCTSTPAHIASKTECLQGGDAKMEQEEVKAEAEATPSESADGASAETKETEEASPLLPV